MGSGQWSFELIRWSTLDSRLLKGKEPTCWCEGQCGSHSCPLQHLPSSAPGRVSQHPGDLLRMQLLSVTPLSHTLTSASSHQWCLFEGKVTGISWILVTVDISSTCRSPDLRAAQPSHGSYVRRRSWSLVDVFFRRPVCQRQGHVVIRMDLRTQLLRFKSHFC